MLIDLIIGILGILFFIYIFYIIYKYSYTLKPHEYRSSDDSWYSGGGFGGAGATGRW